MRVVTWNLERKRPASAPGAAVIARLRREEPDIAVLTEARVGHLDAWDGFEIAAPRPKFWRAGDDERKVVAWSRTPWTDIDEVGDPEMPSGRFVAGTTTTHIGQVRVWGVCIPWHMADVQYGSKDRKPWQQHLRWLELAGPLLESHDPDLPLIVAGDFNQRVPRVKGRGNVAAAEMLADVFAQLDIITSGIPEGCDRPGIDHIALSPGLRCDRIWGWPHNDDGIRMSDHDGVGADIARTSGRA